MRTLLQQPTTLTVYSLCTITLALAIGFGSTRNAAAHEDEPHDGEDSEESVEPVDPVEPVAPIEPVERIGPFDPAEIFDESLDYAAPGAWIALPEHGAGPRGDRNAPAGSCPAKIGGNAAVRLGAHGHSDARSPDDVWAELSGRWEPFAAELDKRQLRVKLQLTCGTAFDTEVETFTTDWLPLNRANQKQEETCPDHKPFLMEARCQTSTLK